MYRKWNDKRSPLSLELSRICNKRGLNMDGAKEFSWFIRGVMGP